MQERDVLESAFVLCIDIRSFARITHLITKYYYLAYCGFLYNSTI